MSLKTGSGQKEQMRSRVAGGLGLVGQGAGNWGRGESLGQGKVGGGLAEGVRFGDSRQKALCPLDHIPLQIPECHLSSLSLSVPLLFVEPAGNVPSPLVPVHRG